MSDFTPGPWQCFKIVSGYSEKLTDIVVTDEAERVIANVLKVSDARLIAAAPEMLECLQDFIFGKDARKKASKIIQGLEERGGKMKEVDGE